MHSTLDQIDLCYNTLSLGKFIDKGLWFKSIFLSSFQDGNGEFIHHSVILRGSIRMINKRKGT